MPSRQSTSCLGPLGKIQLLTEHGAELILFCAGHFATFARYVRSFDLKSPSQWYAWCKSGQRPSNIPAAPAVFYKNSGWEGKGMKHWLGHEYTKNRIPVGSRAARGSYKKRRTQNQYVHLSLHSGIHKR